MNQPKIISLIIISLLLVACVPTTAASPQTTIVYPTLNAEQLTAWAPATLMAARAIEAATAQAATPVPGYVTPEPVAAAVEVVGQFTNTVEQWRPQIDDWAVFYGVEANVIATVLQVETCGNKEYYNDQQHRYGLFGVEWFQFAVGDDYYDLETNTKLGMTVLQDLTQQTNNMGLVFGGWKSRVAMVQSFDRWDRFAMQFYWNASPIYMGAKNGDGGAAAREWLASPAGQYVCSGVKIYQR